MTRARGFTLVEVMAAFVILTTGIIAAHAGFARCVDAVVKSRGALERSALLEKAATELALPAWMESGEKTESDTDTNERIQDLRGRKDYAGYEMEHGSGNWQVGKETMDRHTLKVKQKNAWTAASVFLPGVPEKKL